MYDFVLFEELYFVILVVFVGDLNLIMFEY